MMLKLQMQTKLTDVVLRQRIRKQIKRLMKFMNDFLNCAIQQYSYTLDCFRY